MNNTQLTDPNGFDYSRITYGKPETKQIPNDDPNAPKMSYKTIRMGVKNLDGTRGDLVMSTSEVFSFGTSANTAMGSTDVNGYTLPLCLHNKDGPTDEEVAFTDAFCGIIDNAKKHVLKDDIKEAIEKYDLDESELKKFNPLYYKRERGKIVPGSGPTLYCKLLYKKEKGGGKILTEFTNINTGQPIDPLSLQKKYCFVTGAVKFESIYIGTKISIQIKLVEALIRPLDDGPKKLLRPNVKPSVTSTTDVNDALQGDESDHDDNDDQDDAESQSDDESDDGSLNASDNEDEISVPAAPEPEPEPVKKTVRRVVRKKATD
jgi:hypothetical protein